MRLCVSELVQNFICHDGGCDSRVQAISLALHRHLYQPVALGFIVAGQALRFVAGQNKARRTVARGLIICFSLEACANQLAFAAA